MTLPATIADAVVKALIPPLAPGEYAQLEANIRAEGCRDPLVLWDGIRSDFCNGDNLFRDRGFLRSHATT